MRRKIIAVGVEPIRVKGGCNLGYNFCSARIGRNSETQEGRGTSTRGKARAYRRTRRSSAEKGERFNGWMQDQLMEAVVV